MAIDRETLRQRQNMPLNAKVAMSCARIQEWYDHYNGMVYVSFSGGKDSTVLLDLVKNKCGLVDVPSVFCNTGLEYPEVMKFGVKMADEVIRPKVSFNKVIEQYGYPVVSKEQSRYIYDIRHGSEKMKRLRLDGRNGRFKLSNKYKYLINAPFDISDKCCDVMKKRPFTKFEREREKADCRHNGRRVQSKDAEVPQRRMQRIR